jgi:hypothetical protein
MTLNIDKSSKLHNQKVKRLLIIAEKINHGLIILNLPYLNDTRFAIWFDL